MGQINDFARQQLQTMLRGGEGLEAMGIGLKHSSSSDDTYVLFGLTNQRLILLDCASDAWMNAPKAEARGSTFVELASIMEVRVEPGSDIGGALIRFFVKHPQGDSFFILRPVHKHFGNKWNFGGFDGHQEWNDLIAPWLASHVAAGTLRSPQGVAHAITELHARRAQHAAMAAQNAHAAALAGAHARANASIKWPYAAMGAAIFVTLIGVFISLRGASEAKSSEEFIASVDRDKRQKYSIFSDPKVAAGAKEHARESIEAAHTRIATGIVVIILGLAGSGGLLAVGMTLNKRKRAQQQQQQPPALAFR
jgi:hypothetical protein